MTDIHGACSECGGTFQLDERTCQRCQEMPYKCDMCGDIFRADQWYLDVYGHICPDCPIEYAIVRTETYAGDHCQIETWDDQSERDHALKVLRLADSTDTRRRYFAYPEDVDDMPDELVDRVEDEITYPDPDPDLNQ